MKRKYYIFGGIVVLLLIYYHIDRQYLMKERVLRHHNWEHVSGESLIGNFIDARDLTFKSDTMILDYGTQGQYTLVLKWQCFSSMKVVNPKTDNVSKYKMKGANWIDYVFK
ncbi:hypothetical protein EYV94_22820 [Puteibacter caeruleilacunae]|nr:hypothetical protein EYV94_22820 [Puteibacter caeruleilacunae]